MKSFISSSSSSFPSYYLAKGIGKTLELISVDFVNVSGKRLESQTFQSPQGGDLLLWVNDKKQILKLKFILWGQVVEWNIWEGLRTGYKIEEEGDKETPSSLILEGICYDSFLHEMAVYQAKEVIEYSLLENHIKSQLIEVFTVQSKNKRKKKHSIFLNKFNIIILFLRKYFLNNTNSKSK